MYGRWLMTTVGRSGEARNNYTLGYTLRGNMCKVHVPKAKYMEYIISAFFFNFVAVLLLDFGFVSCPFPIPASGLET
jgi:hypothetical protein